MYPKATRLLAVLFATPLTAHVVLETPKPFKPVGYGPTNPIASTGSDFPCRIPAGGKYEIVGERTIMAIGDDQTLSFQGQAVHGGGSCQIALTADLEPTKDSRWMVIHSIEGGCPARDQKGNLDGPNLDKYTFKIPEGISPAAYTLSWTWLARIGGQPEFYQNCAPIEVVSRENRSRGRRMSAVNRREMFAKGAADFPELFMANMGDVSQGCTTSEALSQQMAIAFPDPGPSVDRPEGTASLFRQQCDGNPRAKPAGREDDGQVDDDGGGGSSVPSAAASRTTTLQNPPTSSSSTSSVISVTSSSTSTTLSPLATGKSTSTDAVSMSSQSDVTTTHVPKPSVGEGSCVEGYLTCLEDETHFSTCTGGELTAPQPIAPGFKCHAGEGIGLGIYAA
ncbi:hypothetical protein F4778DRAFT_573559 [Xylariomycetidae sp. FL2044]|nr:hypothetical protein F4778DRAFT_573559 [Xylariomycetidae sp. FL2044]